MKMLLLMSVFLVVLVGACHPFGMFDDEVERGDKYIDQLLQDMVEENGHEYDPYYLEDSVVSFSKKVAFINFTGEAKLHNGYITGLKTLHRPEHCRVEDKDGYLDVKADLGAGVLNFHYDGTVKFMNFGPTISVHGVLHYLEIHMGFGVDSKTGKNGKLTKFAVDDMKGLQITITGLGPLNWVMNYLISSITYTFEGYIRRLVENKVKNHLEVRLPKYQFPVVGQEQTTPEEVTPEPFTVTPQSTEIVDPTETETQATEITTEVEIHSTEITTENEDTESDTEENEDTESDTEENEDTESDTEENEDTESDTEENETEDDDNLENEAAEANEYYDNGTEDESEDSDIEIEEVYKKSDDTLEEDIHKFLYFLVSQTEKDDYKELPSHLLKAEHRSLK